MSEQTVIVKNPQPAIPITVTQGAGSVGPKGDKGDPGPQGVKGDTGIQGEPATNFFHVGTVPPVDTSLIWFDTN